MLDRLTTTLYRIDWMLLGATLLLVAIGLAALFSITLNVEQPRIEKFYRQLISFGIGIAFLIGMMSLNYRQVRSSSWFLYAIGLGLLVAVLVFGTTLRGTKGWFSFFGSTFQPVELVKVLIVVALARYLADHIGEGMSWKVVGRSGLIILPAVVLVIAQRDLGSAVIFFPLWLGLLGFLRLPMRKLGLMLMGILLIAALSWWSLKDYQRDRILTFLDPGRDPLRSGYNVRQAIVAIGSGQLLGRGLGLGTQSQLNFLPTQDTDFIFAVIAEELGFIGVIILLSLLGTFLWRFVHALRTVRDAFGVLLLAGLLILFATEIILNIGGNIGLVPLTGTPLPFLSYGGSALVMSLVAVGLAESVIASSAIR
ncbi:MAG: rod shape-determining protein RodA [Candidatus Kerfeldbacteria bacterium]|nr:rod shape-determining protein RodA [Candidatus Kerfeldbacteria bacterium]